MASRQIQFHRSLYLPEAVQAAAEAYADHAKLVVAERGDSTDVTVEVEDPDDLDLIADSFANHALYETIVRSRDRQVGA